MTQLAVESFLQNMFELAGPIGVLATRSLITFDCSAIRPYFRARARGLEIRCDETCSYYVNTVFYTKVYSTKSRLI